MIMKKLLIFFSFLYFVNCFSQQTIYKYNVYLFDSTLAPQFTKNQTNSTYTGQNSGLSSFFSNYNIITFEKAFPSTTWESFSRVLYLETTNSNLVANLLTTYPTVYRKFEDITNDTVELAFYPDDYGTTGPNPNPNIGAVIERSDLDYMNVQKAWDITTGIGTNGIATKIGISDGRINIIDKDFSNKTSFINNPYQNLPYCTANTTPCQLSAHGTAVAGIAAAQGNNGYGSTGVCYNCKIVSTGAFNYNNLLALAQSGVRVINMSWVTIYKSTPNIPSEMAKMTIDSLVNHFKVVLVAAAGNQSSYQNATDKICPTTHVNTIYAFPASYDGVISVSSVIHKYPLVLPLSPSAPNFVDNTEWGINVYRTQGSFAQVVNGDDPNNPPIGLLFSGNPSSPCGNPPSPASPNGLVPRLTSNEFVDILAPLYDTFRFDIFTEQNGFVQYTDGGTSGAAPRVSGTAALMLTVNKCLIPKEVDNVLKLTSMDVEHTSMNQVYQGQIGAGALNTGDAVEFVNEMKKIDGNATIKNHIFNRFDFKLENINNDLTIQNVTFNQSCIANFKARNQIHLLPGVSIAPNQSGVINLGINPNITIDCDPAIFARSTNDSDVQPTTITKKSEIVLFPNPNNGSFEIYNIISEDFNKETIKLQVFDMNGRSLFKKELNEDDLSNCKIDLQELKIGVYIVKLSSSNYSKEIKFIKNR